MLLIHVGIANATGHDHWRLDGDEVSAISAAVKEASKHLDIRQSQKTIDYLQLAVVLGGVYAPRVIQEVMMRRGIVGPGPLGNGAIQPGEATAEAVPSWAMPATSQPMN